MQIINIKSAGIHFYKYDFVVTCLLYFPIIFIYDYTFMLYLKGIIFVPFSNVSSHVQVCAQRN